MLADGSIIGVNVGGCQHPSVRPYERVSRHPGCLICVSAWWEILVA